MLEAIKDWFVYSLWKNRIERTYYNLKCLFQRALRRNHLADRDLWHADFTIAERILPILQAFRAASKAGYPGVFCEWNEEDAWPGSKKEDFLGGEMNAWNAVLDEMIFAFEWKIYHDEMLEYTKDKKARVWLQKYGDPFATKDPKNCHHIECMKEDLYHDDDLEARLRERADKGFDLFHKYYHHLWD